MTHCQKVQAEVDPTSFKALVLGGQGLLGQSLVQALKNRQWNLSSLDRSADTNPLNSDVLHSAVEKIKPDVIFNTIAWTQVDAAEDHPQEALSINRGFPSLLGGVAKSCGAHLVHFSTDFVFNGRKTTPYTEEDTPDPLCVYGSSKLAGEQALLTENSNVCVIRTAWLFGPGRRNFVSAILEKAKTTGHLDVVHDQIGSPTYTPDLAKAAVFLAEHKVTGLVHVVNSGQASWCELAAEAVRLLNIPANVRAITSADWPQKAKRPAYSVLATKRYVSLAGSSLRTWPQALREYVFSDFLKKNPNLIKS